MKLRNKKTGEIWTLTNRNEGTSAVLWVSNGSQTHVIESIEELANNFEDYEEPKAYYIGRCGTIEEFDPTKDVALTEMLKEIGNYFETKEEAEKAVEKLKAWKRLREKSFKFYGWNKGSLLKGTPNNITFACDDTRIWAWEDIQDDLDILFGGEE